MYVVSAFTYSIHLEMAIAELEQKGIARDAIFAVPLDKRNEKGRLFDTMEASDGRSLLDLAMILATVFMVLGTIYGFILPIGPILTALIGFAFGSLLGLAIDLIPKRRQRSNGAVKSPTTEVFLLIQCDKDQAAQVERILWEKRALGLARLE